MAFHGQSAATVRSWLYGEVVVVTREDRPLSAPSTLPFRTMLCRILILDSVQVVDALQLIKSRRIHPIGGLHMSCTL